MNDKIFITFRDIFLFQFYVHWNHLSCSSLARPTGPRNKNVSLVQLRRCLFALKELEKERRNINIIKDMWLRE
jgi:hypothetical protein